MEGISNVGSRRRIRDVLEAFGNFSMASFQVILRLAWSFENIDGYHCQDAFSVLFGRVSAK